MKMGEIKTMYVFLKVKCTPFLSHEGLFFFVKIPLVYKMAVRVVFN